ncbi:hypothetical protein [Mucilaginibacter humi]|uniref:hypothetical protein n=1 Tax=Mucilaginibacter humi TaxID=2732510 RepID=UPI0015854B5D|nr:hypothetical protein [Mucilaginibacter humi]
MIENEMSKTRLTEISGWTAQQRTLYSNYYMELGKIKSIIANYQRIKEITLKQAALVSEYKRLDFVQAGPAIWPAGLKCLQRVPGAFLATKHSSIR